MVQNIRHIDTYDFSPSDHFNVNIGVEGVLKKQDEVVQNCFHQPSQLQAFASYLCVGARSGEMAEYFVASMLQPCFVSRACRGHGPDH